jgi:hypothetical protein
MLHSGAGRVTISAEVRDAVEAGCSISSADFPRRVRSFDLTRAIVLAVVRELRDDMTVAEFRDELDIAENQTAPADGSV